MDEELYDAALDEGVDEEPSAPALEPEDAALRTLMDLAQTEGDLSPMLTNQQIATIGADVVRDYDADLSAREPWAKKVRAALKSASQENEPVEKTFPFPSASNIDYPLLTTAALQFHARCYPAVVKGDEAVYMKVFGDQPQTPSDALMMAQQQPQDEQQAAMIEAARAVVMRSQEAAQRYTDKQRRFPELFQGQTREPSKAPPAVNAPQSRAARTAPKVKGFAELPADARKAAEDLKKRRGVSLDEYARIYWQENEEA